MSPIFTSKIVSTRVNLDSCAMTLTKKNVKRLMVAAMMAHRLGRRQLFEAFLAELRVDSPQWRAYAADGWKSGASAEVAVGTSRIAWAGRLAQDLLRSWDIEVGVHVRLL